MQAKTGSVISERERLVIPKITHHSQLLPTELPPFRLPSPFIANKNFLLTASYLAGLEHSLHSATNMAEDAELHFDSPSAEAAYWRTTAADRLDALNDAQSSLLEFMEESKELEREMEVELLSSTKTVTDLRLRNERLTSDLEDWKSKYSRALSEHNSTLTNLQKELSLLKEAVDVYKAKLRDTEMTNDELENAERMIASSLADMEGKYNKTIEKTALLEEELIEKQRLEEENQRLKDELREMTEEMAVLRDVVGGRSRAVSRAETLQSSDQSFDSSPRKPNSVAAASDRPASRQAVGSPALNRVPVSRRLGAMGHNRRMSANVMASSGLASVQDDSPATPAARSMLSRRERHNTPGPSSQTLPSSPSARAQLRVSVRAAARTTAPASNAKRTGTGSKGMMAEMISKMKALENRINSAKDLSRVAGRGDESAIPRPSSRMAGYASPAPGGDRSMHIPSTPRGPRASMDGGNRTIGSSIPVPSRVRRPSSRIGGNGEVTPPMPSLGLPHSQTPSSQLGHGRGSSRGGPSPAPALDYLDHDPASTLPHLSRYATASASAARRRSSMSGMAHSTSNGSLAKVRTGTTSVLPRATTPSSVQPPRVTQSTMSQHYDGGGVRTPLSTRLASAHRNGSSARGSASASGGPPSSWKSSTGKVLVSAGGGLGRRRSGELGEEGDGGDDEIY